MASLLVSALQNLGSTLAEFQPTPLIVLAVVTVLYLFRKFCSHASVDKEVRRRKTDHQEIVGDGSAHLIQLEITEHFDVMLYYLWWYIIEEDSKTSVAGEIKPEPPLLSYAMLQSLGDHQSLQHVSWGWCLPGGLYIAQWSDHCQLHSQQLLVINFLLFVSYHLFPALVIGQFLLAVLSMSLTWLHPSTEPPSPHQLLHSLSWVCSGVWNEPHWISH